MLKVKDFQFDRQCCEINFYSWAHTSRQMNILQFGNKNVTNVTHLSYNTGNILIRIAIIIIIIIILLYYFENRMEHLSNMCC